MRSTLLLSLLFTACTASSSGDGSADAGVAQSVAVSGVATLPGTTTSPGALRVVAQARDGTLVGATNTDQTGAFSMTLTVPAGVKRVFVMAVQPDNPDRRVMAVVDTAGTTNAAALKTQGPDTIPRITLDSKSTALAAVLVATGDLNRSLDALQSKHASAISSIGSSLSVDASKLCSAETTATIDSSIKQVVENDPFVPDFVRSMTSIAKSTDPVGQRLQAMQRLISDNVWSLNNPHFYADAALGLVTVSLVRITIKSFTNETLNEIVDTPIDMGALGYLVGVIGGAGWGNCREHAFVSAFAAGLIPEIKQVAVTGLTVDGSDHAVSIACLDGPDKIDLKSLAYTSGKLYPPTVTSSGHCYVIDSWGNTSGGVGGHTTVLTDSYVSSMKWTAVTALKPIKLAGSSPEKSGKSVKSCDCAKKNAKSECDPFTLPGADAAATTTKCPAVTSTNTWCPWAWPPDAGVAARTCPSGYCADNYDRCLMATPAANAAKRCTYSCLTCPWVCSYECPSGTIAVYSQCAPPKLGWKTTPYPSDVQDLIESCTATK